MIQTSRIHIEIRTTQIATRIRTQIRTQIATLITALAAARIDAALIITAAAETIVYTSVERPWIWCGEEKRGLEF